MQLIVAVPAVSALVLRAWWKRSLTPLGLVAATATAVVHAIHPWSVFFALLCVFYIGGTTMTKIKHQEKAKLTHSSTGAAGGEGPRNHIQVFANSIVASVLISLHAWQLSRRGQQNTGLSSRHTDETPSCWIWGSASDVLVVGIVAQYATAAADTWASELGILSKSPPRLITSPTLRPVPPGTNGGVSAVGTLASLAGALSIAATALILMPFCTLSTSNTQSWGTGELMAFVAATTLWGGLGCVLDSLLGATLQSTVIDSKTGRVIEGPGGRRVLVAAQPKNKASQQQGEGSRKIVSGSGLLDNNGVNFVTSLTMAVSAMAVYMWYWQIPLARVLDL